MSKTLRKYEFKSMATAQNAVNKLGEEHQHNIVMIGNIGESTKYSVDVLWHGEPNASWDANMIWCAPMGVLIMGASDVEREWIETCKRKHPEYFPEPIDEEE